MTDVSGQQRELSKEEAFVEQLAQCLGTISLVNDSINENVCTDEQLQLMDKAVKRASQLLTEHRDYIQGRAG